MKCAIIRRRDFARVSGARGDGDGRETRFAKARSFLTVVGSVLVSAASPLDEPPLSSSPVDETETQDSARAQREIVRGPAEAASLDGGATIDTRSPAESESEASVWRSLSEGRFVVKGFHLWDERFYRCEKVTCRFFPGQGGVLASLQRQREWGNYPTRPVVSALSNYSSSYMQTPNSLVVEPEREVMLRVLLPISAEENARLALSECANIRKAAEDERKRLKDKYQELVRHVVTSIDARITAEGGAGGGGIVDSAKVAESIVHRQLGKSFETALSKIEADIAELDALELNNLRRLLRPVNVFIKVPLFVQQATTDAKQPVGADAGDYFTTERVFDIPTMRALGLIRFEFPESRGTPSRGTPKGGSSGVGSSGISSSEGEIDTSQLYVKSELPASRPGTYEDHVYLANAVAAANLLNVPKWPEMYRAFLVRSEGAVSRDDLHALEEKVVKKAAPISVVKDCATWSFAFGSLKRLLADPTATLASKRASNRNSNPNSNPNSQPTTSGPTDFLTDSTDTQTCDGGAVKGDSDGKKADTTPKSAAAIARMRAIQRAQALAKKRREGEAKSAGNKESGEGEGAAAREGRSALRMNAEDFERLKLLPGSRLNVDLFPRPADLLPESAKFLVHPRAVASEGVSDESLLQMEADAEKLKKAQEGKSPDEE